MTGSAGGSIEHTLCESVHEIEFLNGNFNGNVDDPDWKTIKVQQNEPGKTYVCLYSKH